MQDLLLSNLFNLLIIGFVATLAWNWYKRKKRKDAIALTQKSTREDAAKQGMKMEATATGRVAVQGNREIAEQKQQYSGEIADVPWTLETQTLVGSPSEDEPGTTTITTVWKQSTSWNTKAVSLPEGTFLMCMMTPTKGQAGKKIERGGLLNTLTNWIADFALDVYVSGYFGSRYTSLVNIGDDSIRLDWPELPQSFILTNAPETANAFFDSATKEVIIRWRAEKMGFEQESLVDQFGILFAPDGLTLSCRAFMQNATEARLFAEFGVLLCKKMQQVLDTNSTQP
jgi:hypothetical protein